uniref:RNase H type-1 domain-containing protein n=1 Tax=Peronospora matthiolae TaxID=2874970 RepID=A0AAV1VB80_9STRA
MRHAHAPRVLDWCLAKRITRYRKGTATLKITMKPSRDENAAPRPDAFSDADFSGDRAYVKSMMGGVLLLNGKPVSRGARKPGGVSLSKLEAEFVAASAIAREMLGVREMLMEIGLAPALPMQLQVVN